MFRREKMVFIFMLMFICFGGLSVFAAIIGDIDGNGSINSMDFILMQRYLIGINSNISIEIADVNIDGNVNSIDYTLLKRYLLGIIDEFPIGDRDGYYLIGDDTFFKLKVSGVLGGNDVKLTIFNDIARSNDLIKVVKIMNGEVILQSNDLQVAEGEGIEAIFYEYRGDSESGHEKIELYSKDNKVKLDIYSDGWGTIIARKYVDMGEIAKVDIYEPKPYSDPARYFIYASKDNYYTGLYYCEKDEEIQVDLVEVNITHRLTGVIFGDLGYFADVVLDNCLVRVYQNDDFITEFRTDEEGIYLCDLDDGEYRFEFEYQEPVNNIIVEINGGYQDIYTSFLAQPEKPNIYLYPEEEVNLDVKIEFPNHGSIIKSIPEYRSGWFGITVEPGGLIDGKYRYLFYESENPDFSQYEYGWVIKYDKLEGFFRENMKAYGFNEQEIADFIKYWIEEEHLSKENKYYAIYPQLAENIEKEIVLNISIEPDSILRLIYTFVGMNNNNINIKEPVIESFVREGFVVTEWGGILKK